MSVVKPNFQVQEWPLNCEQCERLGYIFVDDVDLPIFIVCRKCGGETSNVWCPKCEMGGSFVHNIGQHPTAWSCPDCHTKYSLPPNFYEKPVSLFSIEELPLAIQERIQEATRPKFSLVGILALFIWFATLLVLLLWPLAFGFWLSLTTNNPIWLLSGVAALFAWLWFGRPVIKPVVAWLSNISREFNAM